MIQNVSIYVINQKAKSEAGDQTKPNNIPLLREGKRSTSNCAEHNLVLLSHSTIYKERTR